MARSMAQTIRDKLHWRIIDTYILKKFLGSVIYSIALLMTIVVVFDVSENIHRFIDNNLSLHEIIFEYYLNFIPYFINLFIPLFTFISVIWFTSKLSSNNEIIAILNGGISFFRFLVPYLVGSLLIATVSLAMSNFIIPQTNEKLNNFKNEYFKRKNITSHDIHVKSSSNCYAYVAHWKRDELNGQQFTYEVFDKSGLSYKISSRNVQYDNEKQQWILYFYTERSIIDGKEYLSTGERKDTILNLNPGDFNRDKTISETMSYKRLRDFIKEETLKGSSLVNHYLIEQNKRIANPFGTIIMTLLGFSVASRKTRRGVGVHIFIGLGLAFTFIFLQQISTVFSISGGLPPALGTWIPNLIFLVICMVLLRLAQK